MKNMANTQIFFERSNGQALGSCKAVFSNGKATIFDFNLDIEVGDTLYQLLPNGKKETYTVTDISFNKGTEGTPNFFRISSKKDSSHQESKETTKNTIFNIHQSNVQVGDHNLFNIQNMFLELQNKIENSNASEEEKSEAKSLVNKLIAHPLVSSILGGVAGGLSGGVL